MLRGAEISDWWLRQIKSVVSWPQARGSMPPNGLIIDVKKFEMKQAKLFGSILLRRDGSEAFVAALEQPFEFSPEPALRQSVGLRLPPAMTLHRELILPAKAEHYLETAIGFEIGRLTPFGKDEVFWSIYGLTHERQTLKLTLLIVPRSIVKPILAALNEIGLTPSFIEGGLGCVLLDQRSTGPAKPAWKPFLGICFVLGLGIITIPLIQQQRRMNEVDHQLKILEPEQQTLSSLRRQLTNLDSSSGIAAAAKESGNELQILAMLTNALPNGSWATDIDLTPNDITLSGQSSNAANLISALTASSGFHNPHFVGPITRTADNSAEMFTIMASISK